MSSTAGPAPIGRGASALGNAAIAVAPDLVIEPAGPLERARDLAPLLQDYAAANEEGVTLAAPQVAPLGVAHRKRGGAGGGWTVEGRFGFASGGLHASWFYGGFREHTADGDPVLLANGLPSIVVGLFPAGAVDLLGNWDVI